MTLWQGVLLACVIDIIIRYGTRAIKLGEKDGWLLGLCGLLITIAGFAGLGWVCATIVSLIIGM